MGSIEPWRANPDYEQDRENLPVADVADVADGALVYESDGTAVAMPRLDTNAAAPQGCACNTGAMGLFGTQPGQIDTLVLGCTHFPFVSEHLLAQVGAHVTLVENGAAVARQTQRLLQTAAGSITQKATRQGRISLRTTGDTHTLKAQQGRIGWLCMSRLS